MAQAFPNSDFVGYDFHEPSIEEARRHAAEPRPGGPRELRGRRGQGYRRDATSTW